MLKTSSFGITAGIGTLHHCRLPDIIGSVPSVALDKGLFNSCNNDCITEKSVCKYFLCGFFDFLGTFSEIGLFLMLNPKLQLLIQKFKVRGTDIEQERVERF